MIHLVKLSVGCDSIESLRMWQSAELNRRQRSGAARELVHVTRQTPRHPGFEAGSSLYWVIAGFIRARQVIAEIRENKAEDGITRCCLVLAADVILTEPMPRRPFQGWRYLSVEEAPSDLCGDNVRTHRPDAMKPSMRAALSELGLL